mgnify:CR=1 FL=1
MVCACYTIIDCREQKEEMKYGQISKKTAAGFASRLYME